MDDRAVTEPAVRAALNRLRVPRDGTMGRILIVDDEPDILTLLCDILEAEGCVVLAVDHPDRIPAKGIAADPDLFLIDLMLPGADGITLAARLRANGYAAIPMIAVSASSQMLRRAEQSGLFQASLPKPFDVDVVLDCIASLTGAARRSPPP